MSVAATEPSELFIGVPRRPRTPAETIWHDAVRSSLPLTERVRPSRWITRHCSIPPGVNPERAGPIDLSLTPYLAMVLDLADTPGVEEITLPWAAQLGKTTASHAMICYDLLHRRDNVGFVMPTESRTETEVKTKIKPAIDAVRGLEVSITDHSLAMTRFAAGNAIRYYGSRSDSAMRGPSFGRGYLDEMDSDEFDWQAYDQLKSRRGAIDPDGWLTFNSSTYGDEQAGIHRLVLGSDLYRFHVPCPHCGSYQPLVYHADDGTGLRWDRAQDPTRRWGTAEATELARDSAWYCCANRDCVGSDAAGRILDRHKAWMLRFGVWVQHDTESGDAIETVEADTPAVLATRAWSVDRQLAASTMHRSYDQLRESDRPGEPESSAPAILVTGGQGLGRRLAFELSTLYSPFQGFGYVAEERARIGRALTRKFVTHYLGAPHREPGERLEPGMVATLCTPIDAGGYPVGTVPSWAVALSMGVDLQQSPARGVVVLRAWSARGERSALVWVGEVPCEMGGDLLELDPLRDLRLPIDGRPSDPPMGIAAAVVDSGSGVRVTEAYVWAKRWNDARASAGSGPKARPVKGMSSTSEKPHSVSIVDPREMNHRQKKHAGLLRRLGRFQVLRVNRDHYTAELYRRVRAALGSGADEGDLAEAPGVAGASAWVYPAEWDEAGESCPIASRCPGAVRMSAGRHFRELTAVEYRTRRHKTTGQIIGFWHRIEGRDDHSLDAERYTIADMQARGIDACEARVDVVPAGPTRPAAPRSPAAGFSRPSGMPKV